MTLTIQQLHADAVMPSWAHPGDAGLDLMSTATVTLQPGERDLVPTGLAIALPPDTVGLIWDKSGRAVKEGLTVLAGVIDEGYRGEVQIVMLNTSQEVVTIAAGQKVAQLLIQPIVRPEIVLAETLPATQRASGGFGSTGV